MQDMSNTQFSLHGLVEFLERTPEDEIRDGVLRGKFSRVNIPEVKDWLAAQDAQRASDAEQDEVKRREREILANERAADAAVESAASARISATEAQRASRIAAFAAVASVVAIIISLYK